MFVAGYGGGDFAVVAYAAESGKQLWTVDYHGAGQMDSAEGVAVSPDGRLIYVTGTSSSDAPEYLDYATLALDAATGATVWVARYAAPGQAWEFATDVAVAGERVFVTGWSAPNYGWTRGSGSDGSAEAIEETFGSATTIAYDAATGAQVWAARLNSSPAGLDSDYPAALGLSPDGRRAYVAGTFVHPAAVREPGLVEGMNFADVGVIAYDAFP